MSLPSKKTIEIDENITHYVHKMLNHEMVLKYEDSKCVQCSFCHRVCPVTISIYDEIYKKTAIGTPDEMKIDSEKKIVIDVDKCIHCGLCSIICPGFALELLINGENKLLLIENGSIPEFKEEIHVLKNGNKVRKIVDGSITIESNEKDDSIIQKFSNECATGALSKKDKNIEIDKKLCILCFKCSEASKNYEKINVKVFRDRFMNVNGEPGSVWNAVMLRVLGKEGKIKGIISKNQNKLIDSMMSLLSKEKETGKD
ncbi:MAG: 4Fe-4S binding protein [Candidatus Lokiarchaeota archaeon]|nr:4Fe-4S binding protein [Candidatus Lokiarchaeota archaeon]